MANAKTKGEIQKCNVCGNIIEVLYVGGGSLVCCGESMELLVEKGVEFEGKEKHVPVMEKTERGVKIKIGSIPHPMEEAHYIEWIEMIDDDKVCRKNLRPGDVPETEFGTKAEKIATRAYCNVHGLWKN